MHWRQFGTQARLVRLLLLFLTVLPILFFALLLQKFPTIIRGIVGGRGLGRLLWWIGKVGQRGKGEHQAEHQQLHADIRCQ